MKHRLLTQKIGLALLALTAIMVIGVSLSKSPTITPAPQIKLEAQTLMSPPIATNRVLIQGLVFAPAVITIKRGTTVTWVNEDNATHSILFDDKSLSATSGPLSIGASYNYVFDRTGSFTYHCQIYPDAIGKVIVTD